MLSTFVSLVAEAEHQTGAHHTELPFSHWGFGGIALALFALALAALWSFRGTANKIATGAPESGHGDHQSGSGVTAHGSHAPAGTEHDVRRDAEPARADAPEPGTRQHPNHG